MQNKLNEISVVETLEGLPTLDWGLKAIGVEHAWQFTKGEGVKIATIDTGIDVDHLDLSYKDGINMFEKSTDVDDKYGHGTHVAGLLIGKHTGIAPEAELYVAKVLNDEGVGSWASVMDGFTYAINIGVDVLNISLGTPDNLPAIVEERIKQAYREGIVIVCATGNTGDQIPNSPARMNEVIGVGGTMPDLSLASFSNYGHNMNVVAPSVDILSTYLDGKYALMTGTSMAAPIVAGAIALIISHYRKQGKSLTPNEVKELLATLPEHGEERHKFMDLHKLIN